MKKKRGNWTRGVNVSRNDLYDKTLDWSREFTYSWKNSKPGRSILLTESEIQDYREEALSSSSDEDDDEKFYETDLPTDTNVELCEKAMRRNNGLVMTQVSFIIIIITIASIKLLHFSMFTRY
jgi:hypothetical protein